MSKNTTAGLPKLTGSDKQIAWAETIRADKLKRAISLRDAATKQLNHPEEKYRAAGKVALDTLSEWEGQTSASWWIDNRSAFLESAIRMKFDKIQKEYDNKPKEEPKTALMPTEAPKQAETTTPAPESPKADLQEIQTQRSALSKAQDNAKLHKKVISPDSKQTGRWKRDPGAFDVNGIDTPGGKQASITVKDKPITNRSRLPDSHSPRITRQTRLR